MSCACIRSHIRRPLTDRSLHSMRACFLCPWTDQEELGIGVSMFGRALDAASEEPLVYTRLTPRRSKTGERTVEDDDRWNNRMANPNCLLETMWNVRLGWRLDFQHETYVWPEPTVQEQVHRTDSEFELGPKTHEEGWFAAGYSSKIMSIRLLEVALAGEPGCSRRGRPRRTRLGKPDSRRRGRGRHSGTQHQRKARMNKGPTDKAAIPCHRHP